MSIKLRLALVLGLLLLGFFALLFVLRRLEQRETEQMLAHVRQVRIAAVPSSINFTSRSLRQFTSDYAPSSDLANPRGLGLTNFATRARELGTTLEVDSQPGRGTRVRFVIPLPPKT